MKKIGILIFTVIEVVGLAVWLALAHGGFAILAPAVLAAFLILEHIVTYNVIRGLTLTSFGLHVPIREIVVFSVIEAVIWVIWLILADGAGVIYAMPFLFGAFVIEHTISDNVFRHEGFLSAIVRQEVIIFSVVEVIAATVWLHLVRDGFIYHGIVVLFVGSLIEHIMAVKVGQRNSRVLCKH